MLQRYLDAWTRKLLLRPDAGDEVMLVDAFAGAGMDAHGHYGSPIILAKIAAAVEAQLRTMRPGRPYRVTVFAIEKNARAYKALASNLRPFGDHAQARRGTLADYLPQLLSRTPPVPMMFFLDPFGVDGLDASLVRAILERDRCEVLARFSDEGALRNFGAARAAVSDFDVELACRQPMLSLFDAENEEATAAIRAAVDRRNAAVLSTGRRAREILNLAFGGLHWESEVEALPTGPKRRQRFVELYRELLVSTGARYTTGIPVWNDDVEPDASLIHASRSPYGRQTFKETFETALRKCDLRPEAKQQIQLDLRTDVDAVVAEVEAAHAGSTIVWSEDKAHRSERSLRRFVLQETDMFPFQLPELQARLKALGYCAWKGREVRRYIIRPARTRLVPE